MTTLCTSPIPFDTLVALWASELSIESSDAVETHLFSCDLCATTSHHLGELITGLRGLVPPVISHHLRDRLVAEGLRLRHTQVHAGMEAAARFTADLDLLVHVLRGDLSHADRVDIEVLDETKQVTYFHFQHVPFDAQAGEVLIACQRHFEHMSDVPGDPVFRISAFETGTRRHVGDYVVRHQWR